MFIENVFEQQNATILQKSQANIQNTNNDPGRNGSQRFSVWRGCCNVDENVDENQEQSDKQGHPSGNDFWRNDKAGL